MVLNIIDGDPSHDKVSIGNFFNTFFTTVAETLAQNLPVPPNKFPNNTQTFPNHYTNKGILPNRFTLATVSTENILHNTNWDLIYSKTALTVSTDIPGINKIKN